MKLDARRATAFLRDPGAARVVLLHGEDEGGVRERADQLTRAVAGAADDPFRVAWLGREDHARLTEEAQAISMLGGRRVVRVRDAGEGLLAAVSAVCEAPGDSLVVLEAGALPGRSKLRAFVEAAPKGAALACYPEEGPALRTTVEQSLSAAGLSLPREAVDWVVSHAGADRAELRGELEKLVLFAGAEKRLSLEDVAECVGQRAALSFDDAAFAATAGQVAQADQALELALAEGLSPVAITRQMLGHLSRLQAVRVRVEGGLSPSDAVRGARPPVFFKRVAAFTRAVELWTVPRLASALREVSRTELACKQTGAPDALLVRRLVQTLARQAAARR